MENYRKIRKHSGKWAYFIFMDHKDYIADSLFIQEKCPVEFLQQYEKQGTDWVMVCVRVRKPDIPKFKAAMAKFRNAALLKGHDDYEQAFQSYWVPFMEGMDDGKV